MTQQSFLPVRTVLQVPSCHLQPLRLLHCNYYGQMELASAAVHVLDLERKLIVPGSSWPNMWELPELPLLPPRFRNLIHPNHIRCWSFFSASGPRQHRSTTSFRQHSRIEGLSWFRASAGAGIHDRTLADQLLSEVGTAVS